MVMTATVMPVKEVIVRIKARDNFGSTIARAGFTRTELSKEAGVSIRTLDALARPKGYNRTGHTREATAWKISRAFAKMTEQTPNQAYQALFIEEKENGNAQ